MRTPVFCAVLVVAACNPDDDRQGSATAFTTTVTTATTVSTVGSAASSGDTSGDTSTAAPTTGDAPGTTGAGATTEVASTTSAATTAAGSTGEAAGTTSLASTTADTGAPLCPPQGEQDCSPGPGSGEGDTCAKGETCFRATVQDAVKQVLAGHPEWFLHDDLGDYVVEVELYMDTVVEVVTATGLCAIRDPNAGDEIAVKFNNDFAESFDILTAAGYARYGEGIYTATCAPAWY